MVLKTRLEPYREPSKVPTVGQSKNFHLNNIHSKSSCYRTNLNDCFKLLAQIRAGIFDPYNIMTMYKEFSDETN